MIYPKIPLAQTVIQLCKAKNIQHIVISPGSRNAPLTIGFINDEFFTCYSIIDERSAAFFALGIAQKIKHPVAVVCSSGSALLNYYPAVAEAFYSHIPLVVLSADRPDYLIGIGDGQTINQEDVYKNHILYTANLKINIDKALRQSVDDEPAIIKNIENRLERLLGIKQAVQEENEDEINRAINKCEVVKGPVHINIPFEEPLYETVDKLSVDPEVKEIEFKPKKLDSTEMKVFLEDWSNASKKMILVGVNDPHSINQKWIDDLATDNSLIVFTETTSNIHHKEFFPSIDKMIAPLTEQELQQLQPDILLTFGGMIISKKVKAFLRKHQPKQHWHVDLHEANDTFFCLENHIKLSPNDFFSEFLPKLTHFKKSDYKSIWKDVKKKRQEKHEQYLKQIPYSDLKVFDILTKTLPKKTSIQVGNSSAIRYLQLFSMSKSIDVYCNRGTSGIDGCTSTAAGFSVVNEKQTVLITGDLSFLYDSNGLWNNYIPKNFRIILVNNGGGGIFRILPGQKDTPNFDTYFETTHQLTGEQLCNMYGFAYQHVNNEVDLVEHLKTFFDSSEKPKLLEIFTPRTKNDDVLLQYFESIK